MKVSDENNLNGLKKEKRSWEATSLKADLEGRGELKKEFKTNSGIPVKRLYTPLDLAEKGWSYSNQLGFPGEYPFTRGINPTMYRGALPRIFSYSGYASAKATNKRFKYLLGQGITALSIACDLPTQIGMDSDNPLSRGEVGKIGVAIDSLADMEGIFAGMPMDKMYVSAQTNSQSIVILALIIAAAEKQGVSPEKIKARVQNDVLKEFIARGTYIFPPKPSVKLTCDVIEYVTRNKLPMWPICYSGYHIREAGANVVQEMAFTLANAVAYLDELLSRGISIDELPTQMVLFVAGMDFFEEICKYRAFRRMWARLMKERFKAKNPRAMAFDYTTGSQAEQYTAQQPLNNIVRGTIQAMVEVLAGVQLTNIAAMDEALSIPTEESAKLVLRTMQIIDYESCITNTVDPLAGSYYVESLTDELEEKATKLFEKVEALGGAIVGIERGFQQAEIAKEAYEQARLIESGERVIVGVNKFQEAGPVPIKLTKVDPKEEERQIARVKKLKKERDNKAVKVALARIKESALEGINLFPSILSAVKVYATIGEICDELRSVYGEYQQPAH